MIKKGFSFFLALLFILTGAESVFSQTQVITVGQSGETVICATDYLEKGLFNTEFGEEKENVGDCLSLDYGDKISYNITFENSGLYDISIDASEKSSKVIQIYVDGTRVYNGASIAAVGTDISAISRQHYAKLRFEEGTHTVEFRITGGTFYLRNIILSGHFDKISPEGKTSISSKNFIENTTKALVASDDGPNLSNGYLCYQFNVLQSGYYELALNVGANANNRTVNIYFDGEAAGVCTVNNTGTGGYNVFKDFVGATAYLSEGIHTVKLECGIMAGILKELSFNLVAGNLSIKSLAAGNESIMAESVIPKSSDNFKITFNHKVNPATVTSETVILKQDDKVLNTKLLVDENVLDIYLNETLVGNTEYSLVINGIYDYLDVSKIENMTFAFSTDNADSGVSKIEIKESNISYNDVTIKGKVLSSKDNGIAGRIVSLSIEDTTGTVRETDSAIISGEDGNFEINYYIADTEPFGYYKFMLKAEYMTNYVIIPLLFISKDLEESIVAEIENANTAEKIEELFSEHEVALGIDIDNDLENITDKSVFYNYFVINKGFDNMSELRDKYYTYILMETINQTEDKTVVDEILAEDENCMRFGLIKGKISLVVNGKNDMLSEIAAISDIRNEDSFASKINEIVEKWLGREYNKYDVEIKAETIDVYIGQGIEIDLEFSSELSDVKEITFTLSGDNDFIKNTVTESNFNADIKTFKGDGYITFTLSFNDIVSDQSCFGSVTLVNSDDAGSNTINISGEIEYELDEISYPIYSKIKNSDITVNITKNNEKYSSSSPVSSKGGAKGDRGTQILPEKAPDETKPSEEKDIFNDLEGFSWAQEHIYELLDRGVISKSEENKFYPERSVKREEFVKMLVIALNIESNNAVSTFNDVDKTAWYYDYVAIAQSLGIVNGDENNMFFAGGNITRQDMCVMLKRALDLCGYELNADNTTLFLDDDMISDYAKDAVYVLKSEGIVNGVGENAFAPKENATRAGVAKLICELIKVVNP